MPSLSIRRILFVLYCLQAGPFLIVAPWTAAWDRLFLFSTLLPGFCPFCTQPLVLGAVSGFGVIHLIWGIHDLDGLLMGLARRTS